jgi:hypothetical protein
MASDMIRLLQDECEKCGFKSRGQGRRPRLTLSGKIHSATAIRKVPVCQNGEPGRILHLSATAVSAVNQTQPQGEMTMKKLLCAAVAVASAAMISGCAVMANGPVLRRRK